MLIREVTMHEHSFTHECAAPKLVIEASGSTLRTQPPLEVVVVVRCENCGWYTRTEVQADMTGVSSSLVTAVLYEVQGGD